MVCKEKHDICTTNEINVQDYQTKEKNNQRTSSSKRNSSVQELTNWFNGTCVIIDDSIVTGIGQIYLSKKSNLVKVCDFRGASTSNSKLNLQIHNCTKKKQ